VSSKLLIIDDEVNLGRELSYFFRNRGFETHNAFTAAEGIERYLEYRPGLVICDIRLPDGTGLDVLRRIREIDPGAHLIMITAYQDMDTTIQAMRSGAFDYIHKPFGPEELEIVVNKAQEYRELDRAVPPLEGEPETPFRGVRLVGKSKAMLEIYKTIGIVSRSQTTLLITGESGTGKELIARAVHESGSPDEPFVSVNCSAIVETLLESELFGHERGAFTGAASRKPGRVELAGKGTLFLDEIGDMSPPLQTKILRVLQEREFIRVGGTETLHTEARMIAATNRDLDELVAQERFREDLYYRLKVIQVRVPPLRDRREDIPLLVEHFLQKINREVHKEVFKVPPEIMARLSTYEWRGNVRELENVLTRAVVLSRGEVLELSELLGPQGGEATSSVFRPLAEVEADHIRAVLDGVGWHQGKASAILGISRPTLRRKVRDYGLKELSRKAH
jgi:two-component system response regulator AtoC